MHPALLLNAIPATDAAVQAAVREAVATARVAQTAERVAETAAAVDYATRRVATSGFGDLAAVLRKRAEAVLIAALTDGSDGGSAGPRASELPAAESEGRRGRKRLAG